VRKRWGDDDTAPLGTFTAAIPAAFSFQGTGPMTTSHFMPPAIRLMTLGVNIGAIYRLETLTALVLNDHAYES